MITALDHIAVAVPDLEKAIVQCLGRIVGAESVLDDVTDLASGGIGVCDPICPVGLAGGPVGALAVKANQAHGLNADPQADREERDHGPTAAEPRLQERFE